MRFLGMLIGFPLWITVLIPIVIGVLIYAIVRLRKYAIRNHKDYLHWRDKFCALQQRDQSTISRIVSEEIDNHGNGQEIVNIMRSAYDTHYNQFREEIVNGFMDRCAHLMTDTTDTLTEKLMGAVQPIFNDVKEDDSFILPNGIKYASQKGTAIVVLIENQPGIRTATFTKKSLRLKEKQCGTKILFDSPRKDSRVTCYRFNLSFPYTYFLFTFFRTPGEKAIFHKFNVYFRNTPLDSIKQSLYPAPLLNQGDDHPQGGQGYVCMGESLHDATAYKSIAQMCDDIITEWWSRAFHNDLNEGDFRTSPLGKIDQWSKKSEKDPFWACGVKWKNGVKIKRIIDAAMANADSSITPAANCRSHVESAVYEMTKQVNHSLIQLKPDEKLTIDAFEPSAVKSFQNSLILLSNKIIERII